MRKEIIVVIFTQYPNISIEEESAQNDAITWLGQSSKIFLMKWQFVVTQTIHRTEIPVLLDATTHLFEASSLAATPSRKRRMSSLLFMAASSLGVW